MGADGTHHAELLRRPLRKRVVELHAEIGPRHDACLHELAGDEHHHPDRDREADPLAATGVAGDRRVEADHFAAQVHERAAAVAGIDRRVGLDEVLKPHAFLAKLEVAAAEGRDDAERHGMRQAEGAADGEHGVADLDGVVRGEPGGFQVVGLDFEHGDVGRCIRPEPQGLELAGVIEPDRDVVELGAVDHMTVRDHDRAAGDVGDNAGAGFVFTRLAIFGPQGRLARVDVHDRGADELREPAELGALSFEDLGVALHLLVELLAFVDGEPRRPHRIDALAGKRGDPRERRLFGDGHAADGHSQRHHRGKEGSAGRNERTTHGPLTAGRRTALAKHTRRPPFRSGHDTSISRSPATVSSRDSSRLEYPGPDRSASRWHPMHIVA